MRTHAFAGGGADQAAGAAASLPPVDAPVRSGPDSALRCRAAERNARELNVRSHWNVAVNLPMKQLFTYMEAHIFVLDTQNPTRSTSARARS